MTQPPAFSRILLKLSGESLLGAHSHGVDPTRALEMAKMLAALACQVELGVVIGGGNWLRGTQATLQTMERTPADQMGMLATIMNGLAIQQALAQLGHCARLFSAIDCPKVAESFTVREADLALQQKTICLFVAGTGHPYFTTDTAAALRSCELKVDALCKATKVDGVYSADPVKCPSAIKIPHLSYQEVIAQQLAFMDITAITLCMQQKIPIYLFNMHLLEAHSLPSLLQDLKEGRCGSCVSCS